ncbi:hypothetical protein MCUN1_000255 [Malassezia cuniculi]|uniref:BHLH domain-containing protein n=1 Tax=Malassezia cuniculi TaxID=948313 RepID=A0AAF0EV02_9BASI|nr:hypothetical protein MCUN1_000255 [Malassezia cuniculi]
MSVPGNAPVWAHTTHGTAQADPRVAISAPTNPPRWTWLEEGSPDIDDAACSEMSEEAPVGRITDKRQRRRASHNAVERRRRDNINNQIMELAVLLPEHVLSEALSQSMQGGNKSLWHPQAPARPLMQTETPKVELHAGVPPQSCLHLESLHSAVQHLKPVSPHSKVLSAARYRPNKGIILRKSVTYITELQALTEQQQQRMTLLENELRTVYAQIANMNQGNQPINPPRVKLENEYDYSFACGSGVQGSSVIK